MAYRAGLFGKVKPEPRLVVQAAHTLHACIQNQVHVPPGNILALFWAFLLCKLSARASSFASFFNLDQTSSVPVQLPHCCGQSPYDDVKLSALKTVATAQSAWVTDLHAWRVQLALTPKPAPAQKCLAIFGALQWRQ